jgi:hypothetical protein
MSQDVFERFLRRRILGVVAATVPLAGAAAACGSNDNNCGTMCCTLPAPQQFTVTYVPCPILVPDAGDDAATDAAADADDASADAAAADASTDAADDAADGADEAAVPPVCYTSCDEACNMSKPHGQYGGGVVMCNGQTTGDAGEIVAQCELSYLCGRRLDGLRAPGGSGAGVGGALARAAWLEAASVRAFQRLARELRAHGAPDALVRAARACARDEARHARDVARLARRRGAVVPPVRVERLGLRDLESVARENAVEGCVGETYGALLAAWQAEHAADADVRAAMRAIAPDELRHASLGWAVAAWAETRLSGDARERVRAAREEAVRDLLQNAHNEPDAEVSRATGAPRAADATRLASAMNAEVWSRLTSAREISRTGRHRRRAA